MMQFKALWLKELKEAFRDKRALMAALTMAFLAPVMIFAMSKFAISKAVETPKVYLNITGAEYAPKLIEHLKDDNLLPLKEAPADEQATWKKRNIELIIPDNYAQNLLAGKPIEVILRVDYQEKANASPIRRIKESIYNFSRNIGVRRLLMRGIDVKLLQPIDLQEQDTSKPSSNALMISMMLTIYLLMAAFLSGLSVAIDSTAGERERNVLEILLCQPVTTLKIVLAKLATASLLAVIGVVLTLSLTSFAVGFIDLTKIGATFSLDAFTVTALLVLLLPICILSSALQVFLSFQAKSFKEAQSTVSMIIMLPMLVPVSLTFMDDKPEWLNWTPIAGQYLAMDDLFKGVDVTWAAIGFNGLVTLAISGLFIALTAKKLQSEKTVLALS